MDKRSAFHWAVLLMVVSGTSWIASGQSGEIRPGENLVVHGLPPIPVSLAGEVRRYTESRSASFADWHPTERSILISTRFANTAQIHCVKQPGGARTQLTFFDEPINGAAYEPRTARYFLFTKDVGGNEFGQINRYDVADGRVTLLTDGGRSQNGGIEWSARGDRIAYGSTRRNGADRDLYIMDPLDPKTDRLVLQVSGGGWSVLDWSPDDRGLLANRRIRLHQREPPLAPGSPDGREVPAHRARLGTGLLSQRPVQQGWYGTLPDDGQGLRVPAVVSHGSHDPPDHDAGGLDPLGC